MVSKQDVKFWKVEKQLQDVIIVSKNNNKRI